MIRRASWVILLGWAGLAAGGPLPKAPEPKEPEVPLELRKAQLEAAEGVYKGFTEQYAAGRITLAPVTDWSRCLLDTQLAVAASREERIAACQKYLERTKDCENVSKSKFEAGRLFIADYKAATYFRIEAEILLFKAQAK